MPCVVNPNHLVLLDGVVSRITDRQGYQATERWTRNLAEQARLEALITRVKPPLPVDWPQADAGRSLPDHRLLLTPFALQRRGCVGVLTPYAFVSTPFDCFVWPEPGGEPAA